ncbi:unnamed protein product [Urochloa decumbens]|uniref:Uncharacterized protein n=1 Tax=Urochloa decumbens TaxID=240449 RepID=A0ABC8WSR6_9POAL
MSAPPAHHGHAGRVVDVWAHNQEVELVRIRDLARGFPFAAVAVCHDGHHDPAASYPNTLEGRYAAVRAGAERAASAQVALALATRDGELAMGGRVWRFHLGSAAGLAEPLMSRGALVTSDGAGDVAYLVRHAVAGGSDLPRRRDELLRLCGVYFPALYDLRALAEWTTPSGHPPPASGGSGAFFRAFLARAQDAWFCEVTTAYNAFFYGLGAADMADLVYFKVEKAKQEERDRRFREFLLQSHDEDYVRNLRFL